MGSVEQVLVVECVLKVAACRRVVQVDFFDRALAGVGWRAVTLGEDQGGQRADVHFTSGSLSTSHGDMGILGPGDSVAVGFTSRDFQPVYINIVGGEQADPDDLIGAVLDGQADQVAGRGSLNDADRQGCQQDYHQDENGFLHFLFLLAVDGVEISNGNF
jgi:hypothetical protein